MAMDFESDVITISAPSFPTGSAGLGPIVKRWNVDEYHKMVELGLIMEGAPIELIDGMLVYKDRRDSGGSAMTHGPRHQLAVAQLAELTVLLTSLGFHMRTQLPLLIGPSHEPEPDGVVLPGRARDFQGRTPSATDARIVIEVADSSLANDRVVKMRMYATAAIPVYWIVNLRDNLIEVYQSPDVLTGEYRDHRDHLRGGSVEIALPGATPLAVAVSEIIVD
jgi:Uma2 family endonuclease